MTLVRFVSTILAAASLLSTAIVAEARPMTRLQSLPELAPFMERAEPDDLLVIESARSRQLTVLTPAQLGRREVVGAQRARLRVDLAYDTALADHRRMSRDLERIPAAALARRPIVIERVVELDDSYILLRKIEFTVRDPDLARQHSPVFAELVEYDPGAATARTSGMPADLQADFQRFLTDELPLLARDDPLRIAYQRGGPDAVLRAALAGEGRHEITDEIVLPKRLQAPSELRRSKALTPLSMEARPLQAIPGGLLRGRSGPQPLHPDKAQFAGTPKYHLEEGVRTSGQLKYDEMFLAGFSFGKETRWDRKWSFGVGYFKLSAGYGYGAGLRMPLRLQGELAPTRIESSQHLAPEMTLNYRTRVVPFDASAAQYAAMGVPNDLVFGGHEFVMFAYAKWGYKLRAFGKTWIQKGYGGPEFDASSHFVPPLGKRTEFATLEIPSALTQTEINLGVLKGYVQFGIGLVGEGTARTRTQLVYDGQRPANQRHSLVAHNSDWHARELLAPAIPFHLDYYTVEHHYGVEQSAPEFLLDVDAVARVRAGLGIRVNVFVGTLKKNLNTPWFDLVTLPLVSVELGPHPGTAPAYIYDGGRRVHEMRKVQGLRTIQQENVRPLRRGRGG